MCGLEVTLFDFIILFLSTLNVELSIVLQRLQNVSYHNILKAEVDMRIYTCFMKPGIKVIKKCETVSFSLLIMVIANEKHGFFKYNV